MLTEILLAVTDVELETIAKDVYRKAKQNAAKGSTWGKLLHPYCCANFIFSHSKSEVSFRRVVYRIELNFDFKELKLFGLMHLFEIIPFCVCFFFALRDSYFCKGIIVLYLSKVHELFINFYTHIDT